MAPKKRPDNKGKGKATDEIEEASSSKQEENLDQICDEWKDALHIVNEARLPYNLPVRWESTESSHAKIAFNPNRKNETFDLNTKAFVEKTSNPVKFITLSGDSYSMPGTSTPAAARFERYGQLNPHFGLRCKVEPSLVN